MAEGYDPLKAAATSMIGSALSGGIGDAAGKGADKALEEGVDAGTKGAETATQTASGVDVQMETLADGTQVPIDPNIDPNELVSTDIPVSPTDKLAQQVDKSGQLVDATTTPTDKSWFQMGGEERFKHMFTDPTAWQGAEGMGNFARLLQGVAPIAGAEDDEIVQLLQQMTSMGSQIPWGSQI